MRKMMFVLKTTVAIAVALLHSAAYADVDLTKGKTIADTVCAACHGPDGNSPISAYPKIAGQYANYLEQSLKEFRKGPQGTRNNPIMLGMVATLSDDDIANVAAYYASQTMTPGAANKDLVELGEKLYRGGNLETGVPACIACHGPQGLGNELAKYPKISGQYADYINTQLKAYRSGERADDPNGMMRGVTKAMTDDEINAVSSYVAGLH